MCDSVVQVPGDAVGLRGRQVASVLYLDRKGQHSVRVNDQFRLCFLWTPAGPKDVECVDYH